MLEQEGIQKSIYDEVEALQRLRFDYRDKMSPFAYTTALSSAMQTYPDEDLLLALYHVPQEYDPESIKAALKEMSVDKVRVMWASKTLADEAQDTEPWYGTKFSLAPIPEEWVRIWKQASQPHTDCAAAESQEEGPRLHLPKPNPFVPTDLSLKTEEASTFVASGIVGPQLIEDQPGVLNLWHRCDLTFPTPKAVALIDFQTPEAYASPEAAVCTRLYVKLVADALNELAYPADLAGLVYGVTNSQAGFQVALSGYNHKLPVLLEAVLKQLSGLEVKADRFSLMVEQLKKEYSNIKYSQPYSWVMYRRELLLNFKRWQVAEYAEVIDTITPQYLEAFLSTRLFSRCFVEIMCVGNVAQGEARAMASLVTGMLKDVGAKHVLPSQMRDMRTIRVPAGDTTLLEEPGPNPENKNSAISIMYQVGPDELRTNALLQLLVHMSKRDAFNTLRTQQQLGYIVALFNNHELGIHHIEFVIQSTSHCVSSLCTRVEAFVHQLCTELLPPRCGLAPAAKAPTGKGAVNAPAPEAAAPTDANGGAGALEPYSDREFRKAVEELVKSKLEKPKRLGELATRWWNEIKFCTLEFARQEREAEVLRTLSPTDLIEFANTMLLLPETRRKAVVAAHAADGAAAESTGSDAVQQACAPGDGHSVQMVEDISEYKRSCDVWPNVGAYHSSKRKQRELAEKKAKPQ
ncbi:Metalloenzyme, LuxS/M16 peptidase-like protein [Dunaliella salina]|nr:Metalloenzyme, LuxS/M16 peptidase-like protein [Dunaliella salina]|eukprot:KAF5840753.1 Metalloenzyme, LuxS/M16 peptidase-like protein [Dunaliella salina]